MQPFNQDYNQANHNTYVVCFRFSSLGVSISKNRPEKLFMVKLLYFQSFYQITAERRSPIKIFFHIAKSRVEPWALV